MKEMFLRLRDRDMTCATGQTWSYSPRKKMFVLEAIAGAGLASSLASTIFGGSSARKAQRAAEAAAKANEAAGAATIKNQKEVGAMDRPDGQRTMQKATEENFKAVKRGKELGATEGNTTAVLKENANSSIADAAGQIAASDAANQTQANQMEMQANQQNTATKIGLAQSDAQNTAALASGVSDAFAQGAGLAMSAMGGKTQTAGNGSVSPGDIKSGLNSGWEAEQRQMAAAYNRDPVHNDKPLSLTISERNQFNQQYMNDLTSRLASGRSFTMGSDPQSWYRNLLKK